MVLAPVVYVGYLSLNLATLLAVPAAAAVVAFAGGWLGGRDGRTAQ